MGYKKRWRRKYAAFKYIYFCEGPELNMHVFRRRRLKNSISMYIHPQTLRIRRYVYSFRTKLSGRNARNWMELGLFELLGDHFPGMGTFLNGNLFKWELAQMRTCSNGNLLKCKLAQMGASSNGSFHKWKHPQILDSSKGGFSSGSSPLY